MTIKDIPRNPLYRRRLVGIRLRTTSPAKVARGNILVGTNFVGTFSPILLNEVTSVRISSAGSTAILSGTIAPVIQPWYFQPIIIEITGKSYMGAYANESYNLSRDYDVSALMGLRKFVNDQFLNANTSVHNMIFELLIGNPSGATLAGVDQMYVGFFDEISIDESQDAPFVQTYALKFTGQSMMSFETGDGTQKANQDKSLTKATTTASVGIMNAVTAIPKQQVNAIMPGTADALNAWLMSYQWQPPASS